MLTIFLEQNNNCQISNVLHYIASLVEISNHFDHFLEVYVKKITKEELKMVLSAAMKTFKNWKFRNYISGVNETWPRYLPPQQLSYIKNESVNECVGGGYIKH